MSTPPHHRETRPEDDLARLPVTSKGKSGVAHIAPALVQQRSVRTLPETALHASQSSGSPARADFALAGVKVGEAGLGGKAGGLGLE